MGKLIIDGLKVLEDRAQGNNVSWHISSPLFIGGVPPGRAQKNIQVHGQEKAGTIKTSTFYQGFFIVAILCSLRTDCM